MSPQAESPEEGGGRIVTFYSYKGGTGRSMALANVAWILASQGQRVLVIDWDLEAPGLHRYFHPYMSDPEMITSPGIIDFLTAFVEGAHQAGPDEGDRWFVPYTDLEPYMFSLEWDFPQGGTLDVVPAGQQGPSYATRVTAFDWQVFYERLGGGVFLEAVKRELRREYDWILVDSRTGVSDTSGICTVQLPDDLVVCFTLNDQSITGAAAVTSSAVAQRTRPDGAAGLRVFPVRTRVERAETTRLNAAKDVAAKAFTPFLAHMPEEKRSEYWGSAEVPYLPFYAFEEVLAPFGDPPHENGTMLSAMETLTDFLTDGAVTRLAEMPEVVRLKERDRFLRQSPTVVTVPLEVRVEESSPLPHEPAVAKLSRGDGDYLAYVSYARNVRDAYFDRFLKDLRNELMLLTAVEEPLFVDQDLLPGREWSPAVQHALETSRTCVALYTPSYFQAVHCGKEFAAFLKRGRAKQARDPRAPAPSGIIPLLWIPPQGLPDEAARIQYLHAGLPEEYARVGVRAMLRLGSRRSAYRRVVDLLAERIAGQAMHQPLPPMTLPPLEQLPSAFGDTQAPAGRDASVQVVYVVGNHDSMRLVRRDLEAYGDGPRDWRPFRGAPFHAFAEKTAEAEKLYLDVAPFDPDFFERLVEAEQRGTPVAVIVDPWALEIPSHAKLLGRLNEWVPRNVAVFVVWDTTEETDRHRPRLKSLVQTALAALEGSDARRYQLRVESEGAFTRAFASTLVRMSAEFQAARHAFAPSPSPTLSEAG